MLTMTAFGRPFEVENAAHAARLRLDDIRREAHLRATDLVPGGFWTSGMSVVLVALSQQPVGTMTVERAGGIIAGANAIWSALIAAETAIETVLADAEMDEAAKVAAIDAIWPAWPEA